MLRVGFLTPRSSLFPSLGLDILNGLKASLKSQQIFDDIKLLTDNVGFGTDEADVYAKTERLLLQEDADIVLACIDAHITEILRPLFTASNKILIAVNPGANLPESWQPAPTTIVHSLNFNFLSHLTGNYAAQQGHLQAANIISYYDGGYGLCYCMLQAHHDAGGTPCFNHVTDFKNEAFTLAPATEYLENNPDTDTLLCLFSGDWATQFYEALPALAAQRPLHIYAAPMLLDEALAATLPENSQLPTVTGYAPWLSTLPNEQNAAFKTAFQKQGGQAANLFAVLGWDAGLLVGFLLRQHQSDDYQPATAVQRLAQEVLPSPRGWMRFDADTGHTYGAAWLLQGCGRLQLTAIAEASNLPATWQSFTQIPKPAGLISSWRNTYLCI